MHWVRTNISSIYYFTEVPIILKQHIQSDWITNEPRKPWGDVLRTDGQMDKVKPVYPPLNFVEAGGITMGDYIKNMVFHNIFLD